MSDKILKTFEQQKHHKQLPVTIEQGAVVAVNGEPVATDREEALGWIILRLNAQNIYLQEDVTKLQEQIKILKEQKEKLDFYIWT